jgi:preprotein translocase subunit SecE
LNREQKRLMQRQGQVGPDGSPAAAAPQERRRRAPKPPSQRTSPVQFVREVRGELRKVAWPTRGEVLNYSVVVLFTLIILIGLIFLLDFGFSKFVLFLYNA